MLKKYNSKLYKKKSITTELFCKIKFLIKFEIWNYKFQIPHFFKFILKFFCLLVYFMQC